MPFAKTPTKEHGIARQIKFPPSLLVRIMREAKRDKARGWSTWVRAIVEAEIARRDGRR